MEITGEGNYEDFKKVFEDKVILFISLRVYIEYILWSNASDEVKNIMSEKPLAKKIAIFFERTNNTDELKFSRKTFMSKKVMLNDTMHIENRIEMPFDYIFNLKYDDIIKEVNRIRSL